jgi:hypothetical protein
MAWLRCITDDLFACMGIARKRLLIADSGAVMAQSVLKRLDNVSETSHSLPGASRNVSIKRGAR